MHVKTHVLYGIRVDPGRSDSFKVVDGLERRIEGNDLNIEVVFDGCAEVPYVGVVLAKQGRQPDEEMESADSVSPLPIDRKKAVDDYLTKMLPRRSRTYWLITHFTVE